MLDRRPVLCVVALDLQIEGCVDIYNRSSAVDVNALMSRGRQANPVLTYETALRRFFPDGGVLRRGGNMMMADDVVRERSVVWEVGECESRR